MPSEANGVFSSEAIRRWGVYFAKAATLFVLLLLLARFAPAMPPVGVAVLWAVLSVASAIGLAYHGVIKKAHRQFMLKSGGFGSRVNGGRTFSLVVAFVVSAALFAGLVFESPKWGLAEWLVIALAIPLYLVVYEAMTRFLSKELEALFLNSKAVLFSCAIVGALLCLAYLVICYLEPATAYTNATQAFMAAKQPFESSPSALLSEVGKFVALVDGLAAYGMSKAAEASIWAYLVWRIVISASAFFGVASLLGTCALEPREMKLVFLPLEAAGDPDADVQPVKHFVVVACALPLALAIAFLAADAKVSELVETEEYTAVEAVVREHAGLVAYVLDGKYYDQLKVRDLIAKARGASADLAAEREAALTPLINEAFDQRVENVDSYLDWYYSLPADYERLVQYFAGTVESGMREQLEQRINENVDESALAEKLEYYLRQSEALKAELQDELQQYEVDAVPEWLIVSTEALNDDFLDKPLAPTESFLEASERMGISVGVGAIAGIIAKRAAEKVLAKPFFKKILAEVLEKLAMRGLLAEGGTLIAPGVGTAIGIGLGFATDYLLLKADEVMNREGYREDIVAAIEESRQEMLALVRAS